MISGFRGTWAVWASLVVFGACATGGIRAAGAGGASGGVSDFDGTLQGTAGYSVTGSVRAVTSPGSTAIFITLSGATPGASHPWRLYQGRCGANQTLVGPSSSATPLSPSVEGTVRTSMTLPVQLTRGTTYHVNVYLAPDRLNEIVACAELVG